MKKIKFRGETFHVPSVMGSFVCLAAHNPTTGEIVEQHTYWTQSGLKAAQDYMELFTASMLNKHGAVNVTVEVRNDDDNRIIATYESNRPTAELWHLPVRDSNGNFIQYKCFQVAA
jgi:predicted Zn-dependent protease